jgi:hypothetical protein
MGKRRITHADGMVAVNAALAGNGDELPTAVRYLLQDLAERIPGNTVEVRVPPFGAVQCVAGPTHTRGTPPNLVEMDAETWIALATGGADWSSALAAGKLHVSGVRAAEVAAVLPLVRLN